MITDTEVRKAMPMREKERRRIGVSFGRGSSSLLGCTCFTCLKSPSTHGTTIITMRYMYMHTIREGGRNRDRERETRRDEGGVGEEGRKEN